MQFLVSLATIFLDLRSLCSEWCRLSARYFPRWRALPVLYGQSGNGQKASQLPVSRLTVHVGTMSHFSGYRVNQDLRPLDSISCGTSLG